VATPTVELADTYAGWLALKKLEYVDETDGRDRGDGPPVMTRERVDRCMGSANASEALQKKQAFYAFSHRRPTTRISPVSSPPIHGIDGRQPASVFIRRHRAQIRQLVAR